MKLDTLCNRNSGSNCDHKLHTCIQSAKIQIEEACVLISQILKINQYLVNTSAANQNGRLTYLYK